MNKLTFPSEFGSVNAFYSVDNKPPKGYKAFCETSVHVFRGVGQKIGLDRLVVYRDSSDRYLARPGVDDRPGLVYETDGPNGVFILCDTPPGYTARPWAEYRQGEAYRPSEPAVELPGVSYLIRVPANSNARWSMHSPSRAVTNVCVSPDGPEFVHLLSSGPMYQWYIESRIDPGVPALEGLCRAVHALHCRWWPVGGARNVPEAVMLVVTELAEAIEAYRRGNNPGFVDELADTVIRVLDLVGGLGLSSALAQAMVKKIRYNVDRHDHRTDRRSGPGGKRF